MGIMETTYLKALLHSTKHLYRQPVYRLTKISIFVLFYVLCGIKIKLKNKILSLRSSLENDTFQ